MSTKYKTGDNEMAHFLSFAVINRINALTRPEYKDIIVESLKYCIAAKGMKLHAWVIMNNHVHLILSAGKGFVISHILRNMKKFTSKLIIKTIAENYKESRREWMLWMFERAGKKSSSNERYQFWQHDNHPIELVNTHLLKQRLDYLHENPVRAGIVYEPQEYVYSSAIDHYTTRKGMIDIDQLQV